jgi:hypothetical protein
MYALDLVILSIDLKEIGYCLEYEHYSVVVCVYFGDSAQ